MALYGVPIWADTLLFHNRVMLRRSQRILCARIVRGYRTVSGDAACVLAGTPPWDIDAKGLAETYRRSAEVRAQGLRPSPELLNRWKERAQRAVMREWDQRLEAPVSGHRTIEAIRPRLKLIV
jgi:hypothetical protein